jgi:hypothetical protein
MRLGLRKERLAGGSRGEDTRLALGACKVLIFTESSLSSNLEHRKIKAWRLSPTAARTGKESYQNLGVSAKRRWDWAEARNTSSNLDSS